MEAGSAEASHSSGDTETSPASSSSSHSPVMSGLTGRDQLGDVSGQVWSFVESQCWDAETGDINTANISFWLRTLLQQNSDLVEVVARLERDARDRVRLLEDKLDKTASVSADFTSGLDDLRLNVKAEAEDKELLEEAIGELEVKLQKSEEDNKASELLVDVISDKNRELEGVNERLRENMAVIEEDNGNLKEYIENLRSDIDSLLRLSARARDSGVWDPHDLQFCEVTFEQVFGGSEAAPVPSPVVRKDKAETRREGGSHKSGGSQIYDSRSSLRSELSDLQRLRGCDPSTQCDDVSLRSDSTNNKIRDLRQQVLRLQRKGSEQVREVVMKDKLITDLQTQITELNNERDELRSENNANLSVIQRLKDNLNETRTRLASLEEEAGELSGSGMVHSPGDKRMSSTTSLPEMPGSLTSLSGCQYSSKFARSLTRQSHNSSLVQQLTDQLDIARREKRQLEQQLGQLASQLEVADKEKEQLEQQLVLVRGELQDLIREHDNLKDDFRVLVRKYDGERNKTPDPSHVPVSKTKLLHEAQKGHMLLATEEKLEEAIIQLQLREAEMEDVAQHFETVNRQVLDRDLELDNMRSRVTELQQSLTEALAENRELDQTVGQQKVTILSLQGAVEDTRRRSDTARHKTVRLIYKDSSDLSGDEMVQERHQRYNNNNNNNSAPRSFLMSSSDSFEI